jgi:hypothetical protein
MVFSIAVVPKDTKVAMPDWAKDLPSLGAVDAGATAPTTVAESATTVASSTTGG